MLTNGGWGRWRASVVAVVSLLAAVFGLSGTAHASMFFALTSNTLVSSLNPSAPGQSVTFTATLVGNHGVNATQDGGARSVTFKDGATTLGTVSLTAVDTLTATASFTTASLALGTHSIAGHFNGSGDFLAGDSNTVSQVVATPTTPPPSNGNNVGGNLHQSTELTSQQIVSSSTTTMTDSFEDGFSGAGGGGGGGGSGAIGGRAVAVAIPPGTRSPGLSGYAPSRMQALTMLAQAAHSAVMSDGGSGAPQQIALGPTGLAYNSGKPFGAFASFAYSGVGSSQTGGLFSGNVQTYTAGADYKLNTHLLVGLGFGYELTSLNTSYNAGTVRGGGWTLMPYVAWRQDNWQWDAMIGGGSFRYSQTQGTGVPANGSYDATRWAMKTNLTAHYNVAGFDLAPTVGLLGALQFNDAFIDTTGTNQASSSVRILRPSAGGTVGYDLAVPQTGWVVTPFGKALLQVDVLHSGRPVLTSGTLAADQSVTGVLGGGLRARFTDYLSADIQGTYNTVGANNISQWIAAGMLRLDLPF